MYRPWGDKDFIVNLDKLLSISGHIRFNDDKSIVTNFSYEDIISATLDLIMYSNNPQKNFVK